MFRKTRIRLAALNTIVFFILLNLFGSVIYLYMAHRLNAEIDQTLSDAAKHISQERFKDLTQLDPDERTAERQVVYLLWDKGGNLLLQKPQQAFLTRDLNKLRPTSGQNEFATINLEGHKYRTMWLPITSLAKTVPAKLSSSATIQLAYSIDPETDMLTDLIVIVVLGSTIGVIVSLLGGLFLADRALIPILKAWDKQQQFVADASHELRTPLTVVKAQLELLFHHPDHTIEQDSSKLSTVLDEVDRMINLVSQLLTLARSDYNQLELEPAEFSLDDLIQSLAEQFQPLTEMKQIELETLVDRNIAFYGDRERIHQLLIILLENSLKYTPAKGRISIICNKKKHGINLTVGDTGIGIAPKDLRLIFDRFYRGDKARTRADGGTGLGLSIAHWIVKAHNGRIWAESKLAQGTKIHIMFPLKKLGRSQNTLKTI